MHSFTNRLIKETSPYLLQHAHNPVDWFPWGEEALEKAKKEDKPILISIGYSACHWCHVMEKESFENEETAAIMNHNFINIKIDREERPDLDHIYMDAVQAMTGSGGWPLNVFLTPDRKPFYGGTYFPPVKAYNRPSWQDVLHSISKAYKEKKEEINLQAENLTNHLGQSNSFGIQNNKNGEFIFTKENTEKIVQNILKTADKEFGGFGRAPKFPQTFIIHFLINHYWCTGNNDALKQALLSLDKMIDGGIYDQIEGGFARYSTDTEWLVPHFEKMLYDNALLINVISEAYQLTQVDRYKNIIIETMGFVKRELCDKHGGFYSAFDADSEGSEGKYYIWAYDEIQKILGVEMANIFCKFYGVTQNGNWEHSNILHVKKSIKQFASDNNIVEENLTEIIKSGKKKLLKTRQQRIKPGLDDKIILGWNALMNIACSKAFAATGDNEYLDLAVLNMNFLLENFSKKDSKLFLHTFKNQARYPAFLDDYAFLVAALIQLQQVSGNIEWLDKATEITETIIDHFSEAETGYFFFTHKSQGDIIVRKKEVYDGAVPSGNAIMAYNLHYLSILLDRKEWKQRAEKMVSGLSQAVINYPSSFGVWAALIQEVTFGTNEVAIVGEHQGVFLREFLSKGFPHVINMTSNTSLDNFPLLRGKGEKGKTLIYLCRNFACLQPVYSVNELVKQVEDGFSKI